MKINFFLFLSVVLGGFVSRAQDIPIPANIDKPHPRVLTTSVNKSQLNELIESNQWAKQVFNRTKEKLDPYVTRHQSQPQWLVSRLQMYWKSRANQVYINGGKFSHTDGQAPVPTVRFPGTRDHTTNYRRPKLEDIKPYMDDTKGIYLQNGGKDGNPWEWAEPSQTGRIIESINKEIIGMAQTAAFLYWASGEEKYAVFATDIFDVYMMGISHLKPPIDISNGHHQTLVGYTSFEVIQENNLDDLTVTYDFLHDYLRENQADKVDMYVATFKKWVDQIIKNGVTFNNWNLHQARHIGKVAVILENNEDYEDGKGAQFYLDQIMNQDNVRQWSMTKLLDYGYDDKNGIWNESPGYAVGMVNDFLYFVDMYQRQFDIDLIPYMPVLVKASENLTEYMMPSGLAVGFGDTHYNKISTQSMKLLIRNARKFDKPQQERKFSGLLKFLDESWEQVSETSNRGNHWKDLFSETQAMASEEFPPAKAQDVISPLFYAPNVSWLVQRSGFDDVNGLMISQAGSYGNHAHAHGIAMELYGQGVPLAPEKGIGTSYFSSDYDEYYSRFPAHNTVVVNGVSNYPVMKSNHPFEHISSYPNSGEKENYAPGITFSDLYFYEPETASDQRRQMGIIKTGAHTGFYIDVFRSRQKDGEDIKHDYFYHNLGQSLTINKAGGDELSLEQTQRLGFADGDLMGYDYLWDKKVGVLNHDAQGSFELETKEKTIHMNFWIKGDSDREIFSVKTPPSKAMRQGNVMEEKLEQMPIPAFVIRQNSAAWERPFVAIYEPTHTCSSIEKVTYFSSSENDSFVGIKVGSMNSREDLIFSSDQNEEYTYEENKVHGTYGVITRDNGALSRLFLGQGQQISHQDYAIASDVPTTAVLYRAEDGWYFFSQEPVLLQIPAQGANKITLEIDGKQIKGKRIKSQGVIQFQMPDSKYTKLLMD